MPTQAALDIVNALFAGKKDVSDYVATGMKTTAVDAIDCLLYTSDAADEE